jgi:hypothetical protein
MSSTKSSLFSQSANTMSTEDIPRILTVHSQNSRSMKPPLILGLPGSSKTEQVAAWASANGYVLFTVMLPHYGVQDLKGYGVPDRENNVMRFMPSGEIPFGVGRYADTHGGLKPLLFLDEQTNSSGPVHNLSLQLLNERRIGDNVLYEDTFVVAAGNTAAMRTGSSKLTASVADRMSIYNVRPSINGILKWMSAAENNGNPWVVAYLQANAQTGEGGLWTTKISEWNGEEPLDSARSYHKGLSQYLNQYGSDREMLGDPLFPAFCAAHIGGSAGTKFAEFVRLSVEVGDIDEMIADPDKATIPENPSIKWGVAARLVSRAARDEDTFSKCLVLARRLTPKSMLPSGKQFTAFETFLTKAVVTANTRSATWPAWSKAALASSSSMTS